MVNRTNYSTLFSNMGGANGGSSNWLSDYASIKSGAYGKLMKSYYAQDSVKSADQTGKSKAAESTKSVTQKLLEEKKAAGTTKFATNSAKETESSNYKKVSAAATAVQDSVKKIQETDAADKEALTAAVGNFVKTYNESVDAAAKVKNDDSVSNRITTVQNLSKSYAKSLNGIGISVGDDGKMKLDEEALKTADASRVKGLFANRNSYGYSVSVSEGMMASNADYAATKENTYTGKGTYGNTTGSLFDSWF